MKTGISLKMKICYKLKEKRETLNPEVMGFDSYNVLVWPHLPSFSWDVTFRDGRCLLLTDYMGQVIFMVLIQTQLHMADTCFAFIVNVSGIGMLVEHCVRACILDHTQHTAPLVVNAVVHSHPRIQINTTHNCPDEQMCSLLSPTLTAKYCLFLFISLVCTHAFVRSCIMLEFFTFSFAVFSKTEWSLRNTSLISKAILLQSLRVHPFSFPFLLIDLINQKSILRYFFLFKKLVAKTRITFTFCCLTVCNI